MTYEQIQQAACAATMSDDMPEQLRDYARSCFISGARWRIRSVWHSPEECPAPGADFIYQKGQTLCHATIIATEDQWQGILDYYNVKRWAYTADLLPTDVQQRTKEVKP